MSSAVIKAVISLGLFQYTTESHSSTHLHTQLPMSLIKESLGFLAQAETLSEVSDKLTSWPTFPTEASYGYVKWQNWVVSMCFKITAITPS